MWLGVGCLHSCESGQGVGREGLGRPERPRLSEADVCLEWCWELFGEVVGFSAHWVGRFISLSCSTLSILGILSDEIASKPSAPCLARGDHLDWILNPQALIPRVALTMSLTLI